MSIETVFIDFIVPIQIIRDKYPGGWEQCLKDHANLIGGRVWYDEYLFHDGAMNPRDIASLVEAWQEMGFECYRDVDGKKHWQDVCVYEGMFGGPTMPCDWIDFDRKNRIAFLKGTEPGEIACRGSNIQESK